MLKELRKMRKTDRAKMQYIFMLMNKGKLKKYVSEAGYVAYDTDEFANYKRTVKHGRPLKVNTKTDI